MIHETVKDAAGKYPAQPTTFKNKPGFIIKIHDQLFVSDTMDLSTYCANLAI
jgi:hypothetical protein